MAKTKKTRVTKKEFQEMDRLCTRLAKELGETKDRLADRGNEAVRLQLILGEEKGARIEAEKEVKKLRHDLHWTHLVATHNAVALAALRQACGLISQREAMVRVESALREFWTDRQKLHPEDDGKFMPRGPVVHPSIFLPSVTSGVTVTVTEEARPGRYTLVPVGDGGCFKLVEYDAPEKEG